MRARGRGTRDGLIAALSSHPADVCETGPPRSVENYPLFIEDCVVVTIRRGRNHLTVLTVGVPTGPSVMHSELSSRRDECSSTAQPARLGFPDDRRQDVQPAIAVS